MLQKPVNSRRIEHVANLIQEYQIAEMKHIDGKSNCLADYLSRPFDDPLFDIPYGLERKLPLPPKSDSIACFSPTENFVATMTLCPRNKPPPPPAYNLNDDDEDVSDVASSSSDNSTVCDTPRITTAPSSNILNSSALQW
ncbi:unnamed protein product [Rotaria sp. Silwood1]|nr:unnamed protein product [Rotaria sp. Silwood1]CAF1662067.1 unnamed protein product [Rotaria sp. Silwood1]